MPTPISAAEVESRFLEMLPEIQSHAAVRHRYLDQCEREEAVAETLAWAWQWSLSAAKRGKLDRVGAITLTDYATRMYRSGHQFAGSSTTDVLAAGTRVKGRVRVIPLDHLKTGRSHGSIRGQVISDALIDSRSPQPFDVCRVNADYPQALEDPKLPGRTRECFGHVLEDNGPGHVRRIADAMRVSLPRVCQLKNAMAGALQRIGYGPGIPEAAPAS